MLARTGRDVVTVVLDEDEALVGDAHSIGVMGPGLDAALDSAAALFGWALLHWPPSDLIRYCRERGLAVWEMPLPPGIPKPHNAAAEDAGEGLSAELIHLDAVSVLAHALPREAA